MRSIFLDRESPESLVKCNPDLSFGTRAEALLRSEGNGICPAGGAAIGRLTYLIAEYPCCAMAISYRMTSD